MDGMMQSAVVGFAGMTHLGIVSAVATAARGFTVRSCDADERLTERPGRHDLPILEPDLDQLLAANPEHISFSSRSADLACCDVVYIAADAPTDDEGESDLAPIAGLISRAA